MHYKKNNLVFILILISIIAAIFSFKIEYAKQQALIAKFHNIDTSQHKMLTPPEILEAVGDDEWELGFLIKDGKIIQPFKTSSPKIFTNQTAVMIIMNCGISFGGSADNSPTDPNQIIIDNMGFLKFNLKNINKGLIDCPQDAAYNQGNKVFIPALDNQMVMYKVDDALILKASNKDSSFVFFRKK